MGKILHFDNKSAKNRERVKKCRHLKKLKEIHDNLIRKQIDLKSQGIIKSKSTHSKDEMGKDLLFKDKLVLWAAEHNIAHRALNDLLKILTFAGFTCLPKDSRTLMQTPANIVISPLSKGKMWYNGLKNNINSIFSDIENSMVITLDFNFDGVPVFKSSNTQFWPILSTIQGRFFNLKRFCEFTI